MTAAPESATAPLGVDVDGDIGPVTLAAIAKCDLTQLLERYADLRRARYRALAHFWRFGRGWLARVDNTQKAAKTLQSALTPSDEKVHKPMTTTTTTLTPPAMVPAATPKWWGESMTIWGAVLTALATLLPALASMAGVSLSPDIIREAGTHMASALQALVALSGTIVTIYGRIQARQPLEHRSLSLRL